MLRIVDERRLPFEVKAPNATTRKAIADLEAGKGKRFTSTATLMAGLYADDRMVIGIQACESNAAPPMATQFSIHAPESIAPSAQNVRRSRRGN
jgi:RelB antitoxin